MLGAKIEVQVNSIVIDNGGKHTSGVGIRETNKLHPD